MAFYYVYVLLRLKVNWMYVGYTRNLKKRFSDHNKGKNASTKKYMPFELIHYEAYRNSSDALRREKYLKTTKGKTLTSDDAQGFFGY